MVELHGGTVGVFSQEGHGSTFFFELPLFATLSPEDEIAYEEIYPSIANNAEHMALVARSMTAPDIETGDLQQDKPDPTSMKRWQRSSFISSSNSGKFSVASFLSSTISSLIPSPVQIEPFSDLDSGILDARVSPLAPNGLKISMGSSSERRRQLVMNQFDDGHLLSTIASTNVRECEVDDEDEKSQDMIELEGGRPQSGAASKGLRFLVVDDTVAIRKLMRRVLTSAGHTVDEADDGYGYGLYMVLSFFYSKLIHI